MTKQLNFSQPREQAGFRQRYLTINHFHTINQTIEKLNKYKIPLSLAFMEYTKAFDSIEIPAIMQALENQSIHPNYIHILKHIYHNSYSFIRFNQDSTAFQLHKRVRQGDTISPMLLSNM